MLRRGRGRIGGGIIGIGGGTVETVVGMVVGTAVHRGVTTIIVVVHAVHPAIGTMIIAVEDVTAVRRGTGTTTTVAEDEAVPVVLFTGTGAAVHLRGGTGGVTTITAEVIGIIAMRDVLAATTGITGMPVVISKLEKRGTVHICSPPVSLRC